MPPTASHILFDMAQKHIELLLFGCFFFSAIVTGLSLHICPRMPLISAPPRKLAKTSFVIFIRFLLPQQLAQVGRVSIRVCH